MYDLVITVPANGLAPNGARPSADTVLTTKLDLIYWHLIDMWYQIILIDHNQAFRIVAKCTIIGGKEPVTDTATWWDWRDDGSYKEGNRRNITMD